MNSRTTAFTFDPGFNFGVDTPLVVKSEDVSSFPPIAGYFELLDGTFFLLLDGTNLLLL